MEDAYEAIGLRDTGDVYTVEILGRQTQAVAIDLAQRWADRWQATVNLYRVPFVSLEGQWRDEQMELVQQFLPTRTTADAGIRMNSNLVVVQTAKWQRARGRLVPALVAASGREATMCVLNSSPHKSRTTTRAPPSRAARKLLAWCEGAKLRRLAHI